MSNMKSFKEYINPEKAKKHTIPEPIHYRFIGEPIPKDYKHKRKKKHLEEARKRNINTYFDKNDNRHLGKTNDEITDKLSETNKYTEGQDEAVDRYTSESEGPHRKSWTHYKINKSLIKNGAPPKKYHKLVRYLDSAINRNRIPHDVQTYSGTTFDPREKLDEKGRMKSPAYISTTHDKRKALGFASYNAAFARHLHDDLHMIHFHLKAGDPATHVHYHSMMYEHETIVKRGVTLQHHKTETHWDPHLEQFVHVHHMSIVK